jgi:hypothetical protein
MTVGLLRRTTLTFFLAPFYDFLLIDAHPSSLMDSTAGPKVKTTEGERVEVRSLARSISRVKGRAEALGWD